MTNGERAVKHIWREFIKYTVLFGMEGVLKLDEVRRRRVSLPYVRVSPQPLSPRTFGVPERFTHEMARQSQCTYLQIARTGRAGRSILAKGVRAVS